MMTHTYRITLVVLLAIALPAMAQPKVAHYWDFEDAVDNTFDPLADTARDYVEGSDTYSDVGATPTGGAYGTYVIDPGRDGGLAVRSPAHYDTYYETGMTQMDSASFTLEAWVKNDGTYRGWMNPFGTWGQSVMIHMGGGKFWVGVGNTTWVDANVTDPTAGEWYFVAISADAVAGTVTGYYSMDGLAAVTRYDQTDAGTYAGVSTGNPFRIGHDYKTSNDTFDWVVIWDGALDEATINNHYLNGLNLTPRGSVPSAHPGDANEDDIVDLQDFGILKDNYGTTTGATWSMADFNGDGGVDLQDFGVLKQHYGHTAGDPLTAVPEPATMSLLALAGLAAIRRRRA